ncbi:GNAT family N-acetyltransferase [Sedimentitalea sp. XS_ASV28]|uniref:GNAT family N-acetyltransferase n=1 Tax=Sedimentitalea sp. XS_ASV28 TaxID=3241296 RepID=UPI003519B009
MNVFLRAATPLDAGATGDILWRSLRQVASDELSSAAEAIGCCDVMIARNWMTVAVNAAGVRAFLARDGQEICALYTAAEARGRGIGRQLMQEAKRNVSRLHLKTPAANTGARRFYAREGFVPVDPVGVVPWDETPDAARTYVWQKEIAA